MDTPVKALVQMTVGFIGLLLLLSCLTLFIAYNRATDTMYGVIQDIEIYGNDPARIAAYAQNSNTTIDVQPQASEYGQRWQVTVSFSHVFAWLKNRQQLSVTGISRAVEY